MQSGAQPLVHRRAGTHDGTCTVRRTTPEAYRRAPAHALRRPPALVSRVRARVRSARAHRRRCARVHWGWVGGGCALCVWGGGDAGQLAPKKSPTRIRIQGAVAIASECWMEDLGSLQRRVERDETMEIDLGFVRESILRDGLE